MAYAERQKAIDPEGWRERKRLATQRWRERNREKHAAHNAVARALASGKLERPEQCAECGETSRLEAHHADYAKKLEVVWLCRYCHAQTIDWTPRSERMRKQAA
jgi:hypothetical protein